MLVFVGGVEENYAVVLVGLVVLDDILVLVECEILALGVFVEEEVFGEVVEFLVGEHTVLDKEFEVVPFFLKIVAVVFENI